MHRVLVTVGTAGVLLLLVAVVPAAPAEAALSASVRSAPIGTLLAKLHDPDRPAVAFFGLSVAVSGTTAVVGDYGSNSGAGAAYIYVKGASGWPTTPTTTLADPRATSGDDFGYSVAVSGTTVVVGAYGTGSGAGAAYIYVKGASGWPTTPNTTLGGNPNDYFGWSVEVSGTTAIVGAFGTNSYVGAAHI